MNLEIIDLKVKVMTHAFGFLIRVVLHTAVQVLLKLIFLTNCSGTY